MRQHRQRDDDSRSAGSTVPQAIDAESYGNLVSSDLSNTTTTTTVVSSVDRQLCISMISRCIGSKVWQYKKFIREDEMGEKDPFGGTIMKQLGVPKGQRAVFWKEYREIARKRLGKKRGNVCAEIRRVLKKTGFNGKLVSDWFEES